MPNGDYLAWQNGNKKFEHLLIRIRRDENGGNDYRTNGENIRVTG